MGKGVEEKTGVEDGTLTGIIDIHGNEIETGQRVLVEHVRHIGTKGEYVDDKFIAKVNHVEKYGFVYTREGILEDIRTGDTYNLNTNNSRFEIVKSS